VPLHVRTMLALGVLWGERQQAAAMTDVDVALVGDLAELLVRSRRLSVLDKQVKCMIVIACRVVERMAWAEIGEHLGMSGRDAEEVYAEAERRWRDGDPAPWAPRVPGGVVVGDAWTGLAASGSGVRCVKGEAGQ
jgi:hypothetical protein